MFAFIVQFFQDDRNFLLWFNEKIFKILCLFILYNHSSEMTQSVVTKKFWEVPLLFVSSCGSQWNEHTVTVILVSKKGSSESSDVYVYLSISLFSCFVLANGMTMNKLLQSLMIHHTGCSTWATEFLWMEIENWPRRKKCYHTLKPNNINISTNQQ